MTKAKSKPGEKMKVITSFVTENPGCKTFTAVKHLMTQEELEGVSTKPYRRSAGVVARVLRDRLIRGEGDRLYPWDEALFKEATQAEITALRLSTPEDRQTLFQAAAEAWRRASDEARAKLMERLSNKGIGD